MNRLDIRAPLYLCQVACLDMLKLRDFITQNFPFFSTPHCDLGTGTSESHCTLCIELRVYLQQQVLDVLCCDDCGIEDHFQSILLLQELLNVALAQHKGG